MIRLRTWISISLAVSSISLASTVNAAAAPCGINHQFISGKADSADTTIVRPSDWNADHNCDANAFGPTEIDETADYTWTGQQNFSGATLIIPGKATASLPTAAGSIARDTTTCQAMMGNGNVAAPLSGPRISTAYNWSQSPSGTIAVGANTVTLSPVPCGVNGDNMAHYLYIAGTGTPEAVLITGGTAVAGAASGTVTFTAANSHSAGFTIASSTVGAQEAVWDAAQGSGAQGKFDGRIVIPPGVVTWQGPLHVRATNVEISAFGVRLTCNYAGDCITLGGPVNGQNDYNSLVLRGAIIIPGTVSSGYGAIVASGQGSKIVDVTLRGDGTANRFDYGIKALNDQALTIDNFKANGGEAVIRCTASFCGAAVSAPGPFATNAAVGRIINSDLSMSCSGNSIDWLSGNTLNVTNTIIQAYKNFGGRAGTALGGYKGAELHNVYFERGSCGDHTAGNIGSAGWILQGGTLEVRGGSLPGAAQPIFANTGATYWHYHVVARQSTFFSPPLPAGYATVNTTSAVTVTWAPIAGATSYDLLRTTYDPNTDVKHAPSGTGNYSIGTTLLPATYCTASLCTFTDTPIAPSSYTVQVGQSVQYIPKLDFWPGTIVIGAAADGTGSNFQGDLGKYYGDHPGYLVNVAPIGYTNVGYTTGALASGITADLSGYAPSRTFSLMPSSLAGGIVTEISATLLGNVGMGGTVTGLKGRFNFGALADAGFPLDVVTLYDADFAKTWSYQNQRPPYTAGDAAIGRDSAADSISIRAGSTISQYLNSVPDGTSWKTRLSSTAYSIVTPLLDITTGGTTHLKLGWMSDSTNYNLVSVNGLITSGTMMGFAGGASGDANLHFNVPTGGDYIFKVAVAEKARLSAAGIYTAATINATTGYQVGGAALNFSHLAGTAAVAQGGTGLTTASAREDWAEVAACNNVTASLIYNSPTANAPAATCEGTNTRIATADFDDTTDEFFDFMWRLPTGFTGAIDWIIRWKAAATTGAVGWCVQLVRIPTAATSDPALPAQAAGNCVSSTVAGTTLQETEATITGVTCTSCVAGDRINVRVSRDADGGAVTDSMTGDAKMIGFTKRYRVIPQS